jgi:sortase A
MVEPTPAAPAAHSGDKRLWRVVGGVGQVFIATGVLLLLFVAYQLWGTGLQYSHSQDSLRSEFEQATTTVASTSTSAASTTTTTAAAPATTTTLAAPPVAEGDVLARLEIPRVGETTYVVAGVSVSDLRKGPGHFPETALPGQLGNAAIAGHRTTYGAPFARINELQPGDEVILTVPGGQRYVYQVSTQPFVVPASGVNVLADTPGRATVTLISCNPKYTARDRIVVQAALEPDVSAPAEVRTAPYTTVPTTTGGDTTDTTDTTDTGPIATPRATVLTGGWFADHGAWTGVVLWGLALTASALAAWWIGKRSRRWIGILAMISPFVVLLYFFFENVNRLLPANL